jgi:hypothetical protein
VTGGWRRLPDEDHYKFYSSSDIIIIIKPTRMRLARNVAHMIEKRDAYRV